MDSSTPISSLISSTRFLQTASLRQITEKIEFEQLTQHLVSVNHLHDLLKRPKKYLLAEIIEAKVPLYSIKSGEYFINQTIAKQIFHIDDSEDSES